MSNSCCIVLFLTDHKNDVLFYHGLNSGTTVHTTLILPFQPLNGRTPSIPYYQVGASSVNEVDKAMTSRNTILEQLITNLHATVNRMANSKRRKVDYQVGDLVFLKL